MEGKCFAPSIRGREEGWVGKGGELKSPTPLSLTPPLVRRIYFSMHCNDICITNEVRRTNASWNEAVVRGFGGVGVVVGGCRLLD